MAVRQMFQIFYFYMTMENADHAQQLLLRIYLIISYSLSKPLRLYIYTYYYSEEEDKIIYTNVIKRIFLHKNMAIYRKYGCLNKKPDKDSKLQTYYKSKTNSKCNLINYI